jgi:hypothetical protein
MEVLDFYKCYRAYVRGKVESFRLDDPHIPEGEKKEALKGHRRILASPADTRRDFRNAFSSSRGCVRIKCLYELCDNGILFLRKEPKNEYPGLREVD